MDLFSAHTPLNTNLLPKDGIAEYYGALLPHRNANSYLAALLKNIDWRHDEAIMFGKHIVTKRMVAWYGDSSFNYTYSKTTKQALPWTKELQELKTIIEEKTKENYNSCLLNLYHNGAESMGWHTDAEKELKKEGAIASLSLGASRRFLFKHKQSEEKIAIQLEHGSLLVMKGATQAHWLHSLPTAKSVTQPRINLTFRTIITS